MDVDPRLQCCLSGNDVPPNALSEQRGSQNCQITNPQFNPLAFQTMSQFCDSNLIGSPPNCPPKDAGSQMPTNLIDFCFPRDSSSSPKPERGASCPWFAGQSPPNATQSPENSNQQIMQTPTPLLPPYQPPPPQIRPNACHAFLNPPPPQPPACRPPSIFGPLVSNDPNCPMPPGQYVLVHPCCLCELMFAFRFPLTLLVTPR